MTLSDSSGFIYDSAGIDAEKLTFLKELKEVRRGRISEYAEKFRCEFHEARTPWSVPCQVAFPSATQNEVDEEAAATLIKNGVIAVGEGANMPCTLEATRAFLNASVLLGPSKAANAGGVAVSGLEQSQNALHLSWSREEVCRRLQQIMGDIHAKCCQFGEDPTRGIVGQATLDTVVYDAETTYGGSGGPVLGLNGEVQAVNAAILTDFTGSNFGVPAAQARRLLDQAIAQSPR